MFWLKAHSDKTFLVTLFWLSTISFLATDVGADKGAVCIEDSQAARMGITLSTNGIIILPFRRISILFSILKMYHFAIIT
jgi:hypothetical protein